MQASKASERVSPPLFWHWGSRQGISSHIYWVTDTLWLERPSLKAWKEHPLIPQIYLPKPSLFFTFHLHPNSLWVEEPGIALAAFPSMAPSLPLTGQTFLSIQGLRIKAPIRFGPGNGFLHRKIFKRTKQFSFLASRWKLVHSCYFMREKYLGSTLVLST